MDPILVKTIQLILSLSILVIFHEFGHYIFARLFGIRVEKFYLFFDTKFALLRIKRESNALSVKICEKLRFNIPLRPGKSGDTEFGIGWIPFGGYVKIAGMIDESMDLEQMKRPVQRDEFRSRPAWQRLLVMIAGVVFNFLLAIIIYTGIAYTWGNTYLTFENAKDGMEFCEAAKEIGFCDGDIPLSADGKKLDYLSSETIQAMVEADRVTVLRNGSTATVDVPQDFMLQLINMQTPFAWYRLPVIIDSLEYSGGAYAAGLRKGDRIVSVDSIATPSRNLLTATLAQHPSQTVEIGFLRGDSLMTAPVQNDSLGHIGIYMTPITELYDITTEHYSLLQSIPKGIDMGVTKLVNYVKSFKYVFSKEGAQSLGGFGSIGSLFAPTWDWYSFWNMTALLSVMLAFMNILPIPVLDGGHVLFLLIEVITRRKPSDRFMEIAQSIGLFLLFALLIYANGNDIIRFFFK